MTGARLDITVDDAEITAGLASVAARAEGRLPEVLDEIGSSLANSARHRFETGRAPSGDIWEPSARARAESGKTLVDRGHLRDSVTHQVGAGEVAVGTNLAYAAIHQFGGKIEKPAHSRQVYFKQADIAAGRNRFVSRKQSDFAQWGTVGEHTITMPERPFLGLSADDREEVLAITEDWLADIIAGGSASA